ncbi:Fc.00g083280.m01.CDS01 [Cosmosporella sp. VM-42]
MEKVALLTASKVEPGASISPRSDIIRLLGPTLKIALRFQSLIGSVSIFLCLRTYFLASVAFAGVLYASKIVALQAFVATKTGAFHGLTMSGKAIIGAWNSKRVQALRQKLWYEFAIWVLGSGNTFILMVFWPGWWVLAGAVWALWLLFG